MLVANEDSSPRRESPAASVRDRVVSVEELGRMAQAARDAGRSVVLVHGSFDLLHLGHVRALEAEQNGLRADIDALTLEWEEAESALAAVQ